MAEISTDLQLHLRSLASQLDGDLRFDTVARMLYATDASVYQETPLAVAIPRSDADLGRLIEFAIKHGIGLIPRTAGTSLAGQVVGSGIVVDVSRHFTRIIEVSREESWVRVQPGVIRDELNMVLAKEGLLFGPETSTANRAMIGGMVGNNSCGSNSIVYGSTRDHLLEVTGFLSDGSLATLHAITKEQFAGKCDPSNQSLESKLYRGIKELLADPNHRREIREHFPKPEIHRRNTGYALDLLMEAEPLAPIDQPSDEPFNFCKLIAGSEGTLFFATEMKLRCLPLPPPVSGLLCIHFQTVTESLLATQIAMQHHPFACELIDHFIIEGARRNRDQRDNAGFIEGDPGAVLVVEVRDQTRELVENRAVRLQQQLQAMKLGYHYPLLFADEAMQVWELRKSGLGVAANMPGDRKPVAVIEDTAVALEDLPAYIAEINQLLREKYGIECVHYAHAGAGEIHLRPILNLKTPEGNQQFRSIASDVAALVKKYRGSLSGEHGDGRLRAEFLQRMVGEKNYELMRVVKTLFDPNHVFNPHKIIDGLPMNGGLRWKPGQPTPEIKTIFDFSSQLGVLRAAEMCNGSGDCRKTHLSGGTMCPSYMATRNESDTTRARANTLRQVLTNPTDLQQPFNSAEILQVMDLCLSCKGCKAECPSNVDVAKLKAEFLQGFYDANGVPRRVKSIAKFSRNMNRAARFPGLFNFLISNSVTAPLIKRLSGFSTKRSLPKLHRTTFRKWFARHQPHASAGRWGKVMLFCDEFTNFNDVPVGIATVELLERIGYSIEIPDHDESARPALSKGLLREARTIAESNVRKLANLISAEVPLIGIEPSALLGFRDEYPELVSSELRETAQRLSENCLLLDEFISRLIDENKIDASLFTSVAKTIRLHGHCHQKALASLRPSVRMLQLPQNYSVRLIPSGCCGMAGSFGYEVEHYEVSMQIGELVLFPTVRSEPSDSLIAASGTSCRHQILDGTGKRALHPAEILRDALLT